MNPSDFLTEAYKQSIQLVGSGNKIKENLDPGITKYLTEILERSETSKGVLTVVITSAVYKVLNPKQDIRYHQSSLPNGYSGRTFDTHFITPFLQKMQFPAMAESGWLTRSLEQKVPYNFDYSGAIRPASLKKAFLKTINYIQKGENVENVIHFLLQGLIIKRNAQQVDLAKPVNLPVSTIVELISKHLSLNYSAEGVARLPVLALYAVYQSLLNEVKRFKGKTLLPLESHTSADSRSGRIGDIDVVDENYRPFEAVEVKYGIPINAQIVRSAFEKFKSTQVTRYYLLSTANIDIAEEETIKEEVERIKNIHGCHVIANDLINTLKYYLRLLSDTSEFINDYVNLIETDTALKFEHKIAWNDIVAKM